MRIAVDAHAVGRKQTGNETYIRNLLREFALADIGEILGYLSVPDAASQIPSEISLRTVSDNPFIRLGFDLPRRLQEDRVDLLHVQYTAPLNCPVPVVTTVHDVSYLECPQYFSVFRRTQLRFTVAQTVRKAARIIAPSEFSRDRIVAAYDVSAESVDVIHNGVDPQFRPMPQETAARWVRDRFRIAEPYVLTVGDLQARKNQTGLVKAFSEMLRARPELPHHLILVGKDNWHASDVRESVRRSGFEDRIHFTGFVPDEDLHKLYCGCDVFVFPSFYEGFGLPILEAMACGRAVACSDTSAMPEVADSAAFLFDPASIAEMTKAMIDLLMDSELRERMGRLGMKRAAKFSWQRAASETLETYQRVVAGQELKAVRVGV